MIKHGYLSICAFAIILLLAAASVEAADWQRISAYEDRIIYIDNDSIKHISQNVTGAKFKIEFKKPSWVKLKSIAYYLIEQENNCSDKKYKVISLNVYYGDGTNETFEKNEEFSVNPDTFQDVIHRFMCEKEAK
jgi:hypothetical protein